MTKKRPFLNSYESGEWVSVKDAKKEINKLQQCAKNTLSQNKRISIRMSSWDLDQVQLIAAQEGISLRTFMPSIIYKYVSGALVERKKG